MVLFDDYKFHCSSIGHIMTNSRTSDPLGETCKKFLIQCYVERKYGRIKDITNKYVEKGLAVEEDAMTVYSRATQLYFKKNTQVYEDQSFIGTPDIVTLPIIRDLKSSWNIWTFYNVLADSTNKHNYWQMMGYMSLTGATEARVVHVLANTPEHLIQQEMKRLSFQFGVIDPAAQPLYMEACEKLRFEMTYDDIPLKERYIEIIIKRDDEVINKMYERAALCKEFLNKLP